MNTIYLGLGSNLGYKENNMKKAISMIGKELKITKISPLYMTEPVGYKRQGMFLNCVVEAETGKSPRQLLLFLKSVEKNLRRKKTFRYGPRTIDIDILFFGDRIVKTKYLQIPHPRMQRRLFVLEPLCRINPRFIHPKLGVSMEAIKSRIKHKRGVSPYP